MIFSVDKFSQTEYMVNGSPLVVSIVKEKLKRVAVVSSKILIRNASSLPLTFMLFDAAGVYDARELKPNKPDPLPILFNKLNRTLSIGLKGSLSEKIDLSELVKYPSSIRQVSLVCAKESYNNLYLQVSTEGFQIEIVAKPALKIVNYCPCAIEYILRNRKGEDSNIIFRGKPVEVFRFDPYKEECRLELTLLDVFRFKLDLQKFLSKGEGYQEKIRLESIEGGEKRIYLEIINRPKQNTMVIYSKFNLYNETGFPLEISSFNPSAAGPSKKLHESGDKNIMFIGSKKHVIFMVSLPPKAYEQIPSVKPQGKSVNCMFPKKINCNLYQRIQAGSGKDFFELNFAIIPKVIRLDEQILTKTITLAPKFVFINDTRFTMTLIQEHSSSMTTIPSQGRVPLVWYNLQKAISFQATDPLDSSIN